MGDKSNRTSRFLKAHPRCCFCGGAAEATTIDHVPARTFFWKREGPEGFEFPACQSCQSATRIDELVFGFYARLMDRDDRRYDERDASRLLAGVMNNAPSLLPKLDLSQRLKRRALQDYGIDIPRGDFLEDVPLAGLPTEFHSAATIVGRKLALATRYKEFGIHCRARLQGACSMEPTSNSRGRGSVFTTRKNPPAQDVWCARKHRYRRSVFLCVGLQ